MLEILDGLIATIGVVLVLSLIVQAIQQIIKQSASLKSKYMERELFAMFRQNVIAPAEQKIESAWRQHLIPVWKKFETEVSRDKRAEGVVALLREKLRSVGYNDLSLLETMNKGELKTLLGKIGTELNKQLKNEENSAVLGKVNELKIALLDAKESVDNWYDLTMKAFQDHYERRMKLWSYVLSFLVVVWLNQNLFQVYQEFSTNKTLQDSAVKMAERLAAIPRDSLIVKETNTHIDSIKVNVDSLAMKSIQRNIASIDSLVNAKSYHIMRWNFPATKAEYLGWLWERTAFVATECADNLFGWLAMTLLVGLGAPFWYDTLKSVMGIKDYLKSKSPSV